MTRAALAFALLPSLCFADPGQASAQDRAGQARALLSLHQSALTEGDYGRAAARAREAAAIYRALGDDAGRTLAVKGVGLADLYRGAYPEALGSFEEALALARVRGDREGEIEELNNVGNVHYYQARYLEALHAFRDALEKVDEAAGEPWTARRRRITLSNLAVLYQRLGREEQAIDLYAQLRRSPDSLPPSEQGRLLGNLGVLYRRLEDPVKALETYRAAKDLFAQEQHSDGEIGVLKNIGIVRALDFEDFDGAQESFAEALGLAEKSKNRREAMQAHLYLGKTWYRKRQVDAARREFEAALALAKELGTTEERWKALYNLALVERASGHEEAAADRLREAIADIESVRGKLHLSIKTDFLADKRDVYDELLDLRSAAAGPAEIFDLMERSRARTFQDRLEEKAGAGGHAPPGLATVQEKLDAATLLVEFWLTPRSALVLWLSREGAGIAPIPNPGAALSVLSTLLADVTAGNGDGWTRSSAHRVAAVRGPPASRRRGAPARGTLRRLVPAVGRSPLASETGGAVVASSLDPRAARLRRSGDPGADRRTPRRRRAAGKAPDLGTGGAVDRAHDSWTRGAPSRGRRSEEASAGGEGGGCPAPPPLDARDRGRDQPGAVAHRLLAGGSAGASRLPLPQADLRSRSRRRGPRYALRLRHGAGQERARRGIAGLQPRLALGGLALGHHRALARRRSAHHRAHEAALLRTEPRRAQGRGAPAGEAEVPPNGWRAGASALLGRVRPERGRAESDPARLQLELGPRFRGERAGFRRRDGRSAPPAAASLVSIRLVRFPSQHLAPSPASGAAPVCCRKMRGAWVMVLRGRVGDPDDGSVLGSGAAKRPGQMRDLRGRSVRAAPAQACAFLLAVHERP
ncbi:MAG: tetratricopeptide repeat protein [Deltaproteobacteria bacterium]|nr:MAG: tetratricopeptide repeat protein [Deltaproteobacteria bacterium]